MYRPINFRGGNNYLSNFYVCRIRVWNRECNTVESAYQWRKCMHHGDLKTAEKMLTTRTKKEKGTYNISPRVLKSCLLKFHDH